MTRRVPSGLSDLDLQMMCYGWTRYDTDQVVRRITRKREPAAKALPKTAPSAGPGILAVMRRALVLATYLGWTAPTEGSNPMSRG